MGTALEAVRRVHFDLYQEPEINVELSAGAITIVLFVEEQWDVFNRTTSAIIMLTTFSFSCIWLQLDFQKTC